jgi:hypothetical protein
MPLTTSMRTTLAATTTEPATTTDGFGKATPSTLATSNKQRGQGWDALIAILLILMILFGLTVYVRTYKEQSWQSFWAECKETLVATFGAEPKANGLIGPPDVVPVATKDGSERKFPEALPASDINRTFKTAMDPANSERNRYRDILAYEVR